VSHSALMLDAAYPPPGNWRVPAQVEVFAGYLGGVGALNTWSSAEIQETVQKVGGFVGIWVPAQSPDAYSSTTGAQYAYEAVKAAEAASLPDDAVICLDIEHGMAASNLAGCRECAASWTQELQGTLDRPAGIYAPLSVFQGWPQVPVLAWTPEPGMASLTNVAWTIEAGLHTISELGMTTLAPVQAVQVGFDAVVGGANVDISVITWVGSPAPVPAVKVNTPSPNSDLEKLAAALAQARTQGAQEVVSQIEPIVRELLAKLQQLG
jgi:hypothetical protein